MPTLLDLNPALPSILVDERPADYDWAERRPPVESQRHARRA